MSQENNFVPEQKEYKKLRPFPLFMKDNFPFIENTFEALDYYDLLCKVVKFLNDIIENEHIVMDNQQAVYDAFIELNSYVSNYFDNLDVQEEINNKLDDMAEQGTLQEIIADYLNSKAVFGYDSVADMKNATNLIDGSYAKTLGFYAKNDGGGALYKIRNVTNDDVVDNLFLIAMNDEQNQLIAELIYSQTLNIKQIGAKGDGILDNTLIIQSALNKVNNIYVPEGTYLISETLQMNDCKSIIGENALYSKIYALDPDITILKLKSGTTYNIQIKDMKFEHESVGNGNGIEFGNSGNWQMNIIENCRFTNNKIAIAVLQNTGSLYSSVIKNVEIFNFSTSGIALYNIGSSGNIYSNIYIHNNDRTANYGFVLTVEDNATIENLNIEWSTYNYPLNLSQVRGVINNLHLEGAIVNSAVLYIYASHLLFNNFEILSDSNYKIFDINHGDNTIEVNTLRLKNIGNSPITVDSIRYTSNVKDGDSIKFYNNILENSVTLNRNAVRYGCHLLPEIFNNSKFSEKIINNWKLYTESDTTITDANYKDSIHYLSAVTRNGNPVYDGYCVATGVSSDQILTDSASVVQYQSHIQYPKSIGVIPTRTALKINDTVVYTTAGAYSYSDTDYRQSININIPFESGTYNLYKTASVFDYR